MSLGTDRVRVSFNLSKDSLVDQIKELTAELIDLCHENSRAGQNEKSPEELRLWALAMTAYEEAAMWAVKAATTGK
jgi:hypothetical protein